MKAIFLPLFLLFCQCLIAQNTFFKNYVRPSHERAFSCVEMPDGGFLLAGEIRQSGYNDVNEGYIAKLSPSGEIVQEKFLNPGHSARMCLVLPYQFENASYLFIGSSDSVAGDDSFGNKIFYGLDSNLDVIYQKFFNHQFNYLIYPWQYVTQNDTILYLQSDNDRIKQNSSLTHFVDVVKYRLPFDSLQSYTVPSYSVVCDLLLKSSDTILDLYVFPSRRRITLDENLHYLKTSNYPIEFSTNICTTLLDENGYLITGEYSNPSTGIGDLGTVKMNDDDEPIDTMIYNPSEDTTFYAGGRQNTVISGNYVYIAGFYNVNPNWFPYNYTPSWISITKADMDLNMISTHFYGGDAQYCPFSIIATSDGGCFVTGYSYDYLNNLPNNNYELDIFALKVDADGLITELPEQPHTQAHDAILYPNPGREFLTIQSGPQINGAQLTLYDTQGRVALIETIKNTHERINTSHLPAGIYPWQVIYKNKIIESGKWIKE